MGELGFKDYVMEARNVTKIYPGTVALNNVDFKVFTGKVNILIGENGAGKSTLMRLLAGIEQPSKGELYLEGENVKILNPKDAASKGIGMIHQELNLYPDLNILQNIFMGQENTKMRGWVLNAKSNKDIAVNILKKLELEIDPKTRVGDLRMGQQQIIEIAKTMVSQNVKVLIMDEPTSSLSKAEVNVLFGLIRELKSHGISVVYISHRLEEIMQIGDYVTILRDGVKVAESYIQDIDVQWIVKNMVGKDKKMSDVVKPQIKVGKELLKVENITLPSAAGRYLLEDISFSLREGEILGIYGLLGAGRTELLEVLMGMRPEYSGDIYIEGKPVKAKSIAQQIGNGLYMTPEDRKGSGLIKSLDIGKNLTISSLKSFTKAMYLNKVKEDQQADIVIQELSIKVANKKLPIFSLSGGNQQKVVIGKAIMTKPKILLMDEPSRGIDVNAKEEVFKLIFKFASQGFAVIVVASELSEILRISDRILVLSNGKAVADYSASEANEQNLVKSSEAGLSSKNS